jgi:hypothetical protein
LAISQALGLPALIAVYSLEPMLVPLALASLGGVHFMPYAWLHNSRIYIYLAVTVSIGAYLIQLAVSGNDSGAILFWIALVYSVAAALIHGRFSVAVNPRS